MFRFRLLLLLIAIAHSFGEDDILTKTYKDIGLIPDYVDSPPDGYIKIVYDHNIALANGDEITPFQTRERPLVEWNASVGSYYTVILTGVDAPNPANPYLKEWLLWLVVNVPGTDVDEGDAICPYIQLLPPKDAGLLRFMYIIFQQSGLLVFDEPHLNDTSPIGHEHFETVKFARKYNLGHPIASIVVQAQYDESVLVIQNSLGIKE